MASGREAPDDAASVGRTADRLAVSEYRVFELAYRHWYGRAPEAGFLKQAYGRYLNRTELPAWVRDFTRRVEADSELHPAPVERVAPPRITVAITFALVMVGIMVLLVLLALRAQEQLALNCALPLCY